MRFMMIDPFMKVVREHQTPKALDRDFFREQIGCQWVQRVRLTDGVDMWIDEDRTAFRTGQQFFTFQGGYGAVHGGRALICGTSKMGDSIGVPASFRMDVLEPHVQWLGGQAELEFLIAGRVPASNANGAERPRPLLVQ